jgi:hypothetical protein
LDDFNAVTGSIGAEVVATCVGAVQDSGSSFQQGAETGMPKSVFGSCAQLFTVNFVEGFAVTSPVRGPVTFIEVTGARWLAP